MIALYLISGLAMLIAGAELLVKGASRLAFAAGISTLIVGLTIVAFGTSAPELAISILSVLDGQSDVAVGNVVGSNIFNILFILGISALIIPLSVSPALIRQEVPVMIGISILLLLFVQDYILTRVESFILLVGLCLYLLFIYLQTRRVSGKNGENRETGDGEKTGENAKNSFFEEEVLNSTDSTEPEEGSWIKNILFVLGGLGLLVLGSHLFIDGAIGLARYMNVSEVVIGLTIVAAGTSLPEVVTSVIAALRGERDIAVGNVVGSNLFNIMGVLGISGLLSPEGITVSSSMVHFDIPVMILVALLALPVFFTGGVISRVEGSMLFIYYILYTLYLILDARQHDVLPAFSTAIVWYVIPLTALTLGIFTLLELRKRTLL